MVEFFAGLIEEKPTYIRVKENSISLRWGLEEIYTFDKSGRIFSAYIGGINYRRALDGRILKKGRKGGRIEIKILRDKEESLFYSKLFRRINSIKLEGFVKIPDEIKDAIERIKNFDEERLAEDSKKFRSIYKPVSILPPDQYLSLVLQITEGCPWNRCIFCHFYRERPFRIKGVEEIERHIEEVLDYFGESIVLRKSIFLADANALVVPTKYLISIFELINDKFLIIPDHLEGEERVKWERENPIHFRGIYAFVDVFTGKKKSIEEYRALKKRNLKRVYIGLETGDRELLQILNKPTTPEDAIELVKRLKGAGINVGVIILLGVGGEEFRRRHFENSLRTLKEMELDKGDIVYISPLYFEPGDEYDRVMGEMGITHMKEEEIGKEILKYKKIFRTELKNKPKVTIYDIREFIY
jgi:radical SAM superfamily enzyme YgiQ (UPF0313 family)